jgi:hypothetical protein
MPIEDKKPKNDPMIDVGETEGADVELGNNEQSKAVAEEKKEEKIEVQQEPEKPVVEAKEEEKKVESKKDGLEEYSESVKKRIAKLTHKIREAERQREEAIHFANSVKAEKEQIESRILKTDQRYVSEFENRVKSSLDNVKIALRSAINAGDIDAQVSAQEQIAQLTMEAARLNSIKSSQELPKQQKEVTINPQQQFAQTPQTDPKAEDWASRNSWFGNDSAMTYTAFDMHKKLVEEEGMDPRSDEYYAEIDKRIRLEFPHKFATKETVSTENTIKPVQNVASANRPSQSGRKKTVRLTPSQVAIAKRLGVPLEEYAKHLTTKEV